MGNKKINYWGYIDKTMKIMAFLGALGVVVAVFVGYGVWKEREKNHKEQLKNVTFNDKVDKQKTYDFVNTEINEVMIFRQSDTLSKRTDTTIQIQKQLKELILTQNNMLDSIRKDNKIKEKSRNSRENKMDLILMKLDSINN